MEGQEHTLPLGGPRSCVAPHVLEHHHSAGELSVPAWTRGRINVKRLIAFAAALIALTAGIAIASPGSGVVPKDLAREDFGDL